MSINSIWNALIALINALLSTVFSFLPVSPFKDQIENFSNNKVLQFLNWFIPIGDFLTITMVWLSAIIVFYTYQIILRWIKAIDD